MTNFAQRDREIMQLVSEGNTSKEIGARLNLSHKTIEQRLDILKAAHEAENLPHLVAIAIKKNLIKLK